MQVQPNPSSLKLLLLEQWEASSIQSLNAGCMPFMNWDTDSIRNGGAPAHDPLCGVEHGLHAVVLGILIFDSTISSCWYHFDFHRGWECAQERHFLSLSWIVQRQTCLKLNRNTLPLVIMTVATCCLIEPFSLRTCYMWGYLVGHYPILWLQRGTYQTRLFRDLKKQPLCCAFSPPTFAVHCDVQRWDSVATEGRKALPLSPTPTPHSFLLPSHASSLSQWLVLESFYGALCLWRQDGSWVRSVLPQTPPSPELFIPPREAGGGDCRFHDVL